MPSFSIKVVAKNNEFLKNTQVNTSIREGESLRTVNDRLNVFREQPLAGFAQHMRNPSMPRSESNHVHARKVFTPLMTSTAATHAHL
jgi:hypothetical protein